MKENNQYLFIEK